jgi:hypothetical protein
MHAAVFRLALREVGRGEWLTGPRGIQIDPASSPPKLSRPTNQLTPERKSHARAPAGETTMLFWIKVAFWIAEAICLWRLYREITRVRASSLLST